VSNAQTRISNVAHFFLSDLNAGGEAAAQNILDTDSVFDNESGRQRITRVAPNGNQYSYPPSPQLTDRTLKVDPSDFLSESQDEFSETQESGDAVYFLDVFCSHLRGQSQQALTLLARTLAGQGKRVAVVRFDSSSIVLTDFSGKSDAPVRGCRIPDGKVVHFNDDIDAISEEWDYVLLSRDILAETCDDQFSKLTDSVCVLASPERPRFIDSYRVLKSISRNRKLSAGIFVINADSFKQAQEVHARIAQTAREHLGLEIDHFGYSIENQTIVERELARIETNGQLEVYLQRFDEWRQSIKAEPGSQESPVLISEVFDPVPMPQSIEQEEIAEKKEVQNSPTEVFSEEKASSADDDLIVLNLPEHTEDLSLAQLIGQKILFGVYPVADQFFKFLKSINIDCIRFVNADETATIVLVLKKDQDTEMLDWILEHFPEKQDKLILVTQKNLGRFERTRWSRHFNQIEILNMVFGKIHSQNTVIIDRH